MSSHKFPPFENSVRIRKVNLFGRKYPLVIVIAITCCYAFAKAEKKTSPLYVFIVTS
nr:hypothetical protein [uncultured bacterium]